MRVIIEIDGVRSDEDKAWFADVPDLNPCTAFGDTPELAVAAAQIVMAAWLGSAAADGNPIPEAAYKPRHPSVSRSLTVRIA